MRILSLQKFFLSLSDSEKEEFAAACKTKVGQVQQIMYGYRKCNPALAIAIDRESKGQVTCEELCPEADFAYLRNSNNEVA
ncbi:hypothetical protein D7V21_09620 [Acinetobacter guerrae]|uniref:Transcriptional regulator n=1 Tax=Acinetobacter guerrae TaxID=1843371 RepID=A0A3A8EGX6_9GAMM|nr:YdaS family helix-turn-helix protein [Acinetobacter guerrae]RKG33419.1 hypothetical protein D7V21_09620 [Acinetobacter guerrae]